MSGENGPDVSKVISILMENPGILEEISSLIKKREASDARDAENKEESAPPPAEVQISAEPVVAEERSQPRPRASNRRSELIGALKPYLSSERAKAIDSMMTIADIFDMMKAR